MNCDEDELDEHDLQQQKVHLSRRRPDVITFVLFSTE